MTVWPSSSADARVRVTTLPLTDTLLTATVPWEPSPFTTFTVNCPGPGAGSPCNSRSKVSATACSLATALTSLGSLAQSVRNPPITDAVKPPGSVAVSITVVIIGSASAGLTALQSASLSSRNHTRSYSPTGFRLPPESR